MLSSEFFKNSNYFSDIFNMEDVWSRIDRLMYEYKFLYKNIANTLEINESTVSTWRKNRTIPRADDLVKIAKLLGTSVEYLVTGEYEGGITEEQRNLIKKFEILDERDKTTVKGLIDFMIGKAGREYFERMKNTPEYEEFLKENPFDQPNMIYDPNTDEIRPIRRGRPKKAGKTEK